MFDKFMNLCNTYRDNDKQDTTDIYDYLDTLSDEELKILLKHEEESKNYYSALEQGLKIMLNSIYGAFGNKYFVASTLEIATAITAMGRSVIQLMDRTIEDYTYNKWHLDEELHKILNITDVNKIDDRYIHRESKVIYKGVVKENDVIEGIYQRKNGVCLYLDTDSIFLSFINYMKSCSFYKEASWSEKKQFIMDMAKHRLEPMFEEVLSEFAAKYNVKNVHKFEMENINESILFLTKKKYIKHTIWEDGTSYDRLTKIVPKGVTLVQKGTPKFVKEKLNDIIYYIFDNTQNLSLTPIMKKVVAWRKEFEFYDIDDICRQQSVNKYYSSKILFEGKLINSPGVISDKKELRLAKGTTSGTKCASYFNHLLHNNPEYLTKYEHIKAGSKIKYYCCIPDENLNLYVDDIQIDSKGKKQTLSKFGYLRGEFPTEFAPKVDYKMQFYNEFTKPLNFYLTALGFPNITERVSIINSVF